MRRDLGVAPPARGQHAGGELGGGEVVGHVISGGRVVHAPPAGREPVGDIDDAAEVVGPGGLDRGLEHATEKPMVLAQRLDQAIGPGEIPRRQQMPAGLVRAALCHEVHDGNEMQVDGGDGIDVVLHGEGAQHHAQARLVLTLQIEAVRLHVAGEEPQARRQEGQHLARGRQALGLGDVQKHARRARHEGRGGGHLKRAPPDGFPDAGAGAREGSAGVVDAVEGEARVRADEAGRKARSRVLARKERACEGGRLRGIAGEVGELRQRHVAARTLGKRLGVLAGMAGGKGRVHEGHEGVARPLPAPGHQGPLILKIRFFAGPPQVSGPDGTRGHKPGATRALSAGNAPARAHELHGARRHAPATRRLRGRDELHMAPPFLHSDSLPELQRRDSSFERRFELGFRKVF